MRIALIGCMVMSREISKIVSDSENIIRCWWLKQGLHDTPVLLTAELQRLIDDIEQENTTIVKSMQYEAIVLAYGLCSNGVIGIHSNTLPIVVPRCDDCISLFLGSYERYKDLFSKMPGTFWYTRGWIEQSLVPSKENDLIRREDYIEKYGEENADYLMEATTNWRDNYSGNCFITWPGFESEKYEHFTQQAADDYNWNFNVIEGDNNLLNKLVNGPWNNMEFFICPPGKKIVSDYSGNMFNYSD